MVTPVGTPISVLSAMPAGAGASDIVKLVGIGACGDFQPVQGILDHEFPGGGGIALSAGGFQSPPSITSGHRARFVHGRNTDPSWLSKTAPVRRDPAQLCAPIFAGDIVCVGGLNVAGIPGAYLPEVFEENTDPASNYINRSMLNAMRALEGSIDVLLMCEAPRHVEFKKHGLDLGLEIMHGLVLNFKPRLVLFGGHDAPFLGKLGDTRIVGIDRPDRSYVVIEFDTKTETMSVVEKRAERPRSAGAGYQYRWQSGSSDDTNSSTLFKARILMGHERDMADLLKARYYDEILADVKERILKKLGSINDADHIATVRAGWAVNKAIFFAGKYASARVKKPDMDDAELRKLTDFIFDKMRRDVSPGELDEIMLAYEACLKALGLVRD